MTTDREDHLTDTEARTQIRRIADRYLHELAAILDRRTNPDGRWAVPGDLDQYGDGTGLASILDGQILDPVREATERAAAGVAGVLRRVEADKQRRIPGYRPDGATPPIT